MPSMVVLVAHDQGDVDEVITRWHEAGAPAVTIIDSMGTRRPEEALRGELPLLPSIRDLLQSDDAPRKTVFAVVPDELVDALVQATGEAIGGRPDSGAGFLFVLPVARVVRLGRPA